MPKRSNLFQDVVAIVHRHMAADDAAVEIEESMMLPSATTGALREVDVVVRRQLAGYPVMVKIEATSKGRPGDRIWVGQLVDKHNDLPSGLLVLVSESGFTEDGRAYAEARGALCIEPSDLAENRASDAIIGALPALYPKMIALTAESATGWIERDGQLAIDNLPADTIVYSEDGCELMSVVAVLNHMLDTNFPGLAQQIGLADIAEDRDEFFTFGIRETLEVGGVTHRPHLRWEREDGRAELVRLRQLEITGRASVRVGEVPLSHKRIRGSDVAYGQGTLDAKEAVIVVSEEPRTGKQATIRLRAPDGTTVTQSLKMVEPDASAPTQERER